LVIQSDQGNEFLNKKIKKYYKDNHIFHSVTNPYSPQSNGGIERFNRTLKSMLLKYFSLTDNFRWIDVLDDVLENYNNSYHSTIQMRPNEVTEKNTNQVLMNIENKLFNPKIKNIEKLEKGDVVRVKLAKKKLDKKIGETFSDKLYTIANIKSGQQGLVWDQYAVVDSNNHKVRKQYILPQLQKVSGNKTELPTEQRKKLEKIIKTTRKNAIDFKDTKENQREIVEKILDEKKEVKRNIMKPIRFRD